MQTLTKLPEFQKTTTYFRNLSYEEIREHEAKRGETTETAQGAMTVDTGIYTGRSPKDKFLVEEPSSKDNL